MTMGKYILDIPQRNIKPDTSGVHLYLKDINPSFSLKIVIWMTNQKNRDHSQIGILMLVMLLRIYSFFDVYGYKTLQ